MATNNSCDFGTGTSGQVLTSNGAGVAPTFQAAAGGGVTSVSGTTNQVSVATGTTTPVISLVGPYTPSTYTAHGVLIGEGSSSIAALAAGTSGQILQSGGGSADPAYSTSTYPTTNAINTLLYASSANVMAALATANSGILSTNGSGVPSITTTPTAASITLGNVGSTTSSFSYATITLTSSQIKTLHGTPVTFIAAPGAGKTILLLGPVYACTNYGGTNAFTASASQIISLFWGTTLRCYDTVTNAMLTATSSEFVQATPNGSGNTPLTNVSNVAINCYNSVATEISGNAAGNNTITISGWYSIISM